MKNVTVIYWVNYGEVVVMDIVNFVEHFIQQAEVCDNELGITNYVERMVEDYEIVI